MRIRSTWLLLHILTALSLRSCYTYYHWAPQCPRVVTTAIRSAIDPNNLKTGTIEENLSTFRLAWKKALSGDASGLSSIMTEGLKWSNPVLQGASEKEFKEALGQFGGFFSEPSVQFFDRKLIDSNSMTINYQLSFWYPSPWRPRIIIPGKVTLKSRSADFKEITEVTETWDISLSEIFFNQCLPRFWDLWHSFSSPTPEYPPVKVLGTEGKVQFLELPETLVIDVQWSGLAQFPVPDYSSFLARMFTYDLITAPVGSSCTEYSRIRSLWKTENW